MKFSNLPEFLKCRSFGIESKMGKHTVCRASFFIEPEKAEEFLYSAEQRKKIEISSNSGIRVMEGILSDVAVSYGITDVIADVTVMSESLLLCEQGKERIFQNPQKTFSDILKEFEGVETGRCEHLNDTVEEIIYQHNMDDFSFLLYLADRCGTGLWITEDGKVSFGMLNNTKMMNDSEKLYQKSVIEKKITARKSGREINILTMEQFPNGSVLRYGQTDYIIDKLSIYEEYGGEVYFKYTGFTNPPFRQPYRRLEKLMTKAKVTDNKDPENLGRIRVEFVEFSDKDTEKTWISYVTPFVGKNKGGFAMLPDIGDMVVVCISEGIPYVIGSIRNDKLPENCQNIDKKYISVKDSVMTIDESEIVCRQGDKTSCTMTADSFSAEHDKSKMILDDNSVSVQKEKSVITVNSDTVKAETGKSVITLKQDEITAESGKGKLHIANGKTVLTGGKSELLLNSGKTKLSGSSIDLSTQGVSL